jgi:hypothetical protein
MSGMAWQESNWPKQYVGKADELRSTATATRRGEPQEAAAFTRLRRSHARS